MTDFDQSELLLAHAAGLRRLAYCLVRDADEAEDVLQETWVRALEHAPSRLERPAAWLRQVLRGVVHKRLRGATRRRDRELSVAGERPENDTLDLVARSELLARVVDAVQALEPSLREVVLLRHFEGLPPRRIAQRIETPIATVNGRLQRAHARLRRELDGDGDGRWIPGLVACLGLDRELPLASGALAAGVMVMTSTAIWKWTAAATALCASILIWQHSTQDALEPAVILAPPEVVDRLEPPEQLAVRLTPREVLTETPQAAPAPPTESAHEYHLRVRALGPDDLPVAGATLFIAPPGIEANAVGRTDRDGWVEARWRARSSSLEVDWCVLSQPLGTNLARITLDAGESYEFAASLHAAPPAPLPLDPRERKRFPRTRRKLERLGKAEAPQLYDKGSRTLDIHLQPLRDADGLLVFRSKAAQPEVIEDHLEAPDRIEHLIQPRGELGPNEWAVLCIVRDADDRFIESLRVGVGPRLSALSFAQQPEDGRIHELRGYGIDDVILFAGGGDLGRAEKLLSVVPGETQIWMATLDRGLELNGSVKLASGEPAARWLVSIESDGEARAHADRTLTDDEGRFSIPNCPQVPLRVTARPASGDSPLPWIVVEGVLAAAGDLELSNVNRLGASLVIDGPISHAFTELRLVGEDHGVVAWIEPDARRDVRVSGLPPGRYHLESLAGARGWTLGAPFDLYADHELRLAPPALPVPARLALRGLPVDGYRDLSFERLDGAWPLVLEAQLYSAPRSEWLFPPGRYRLTVPGHPEWTREFLLAEGRERIVDLTSPVEAR